MCAHGVRADCGWQQLYPDPGRGQRPSIHKRSDSASAKPTVWSRTRRGLRTAERPGTVMLQSHPHNTSIPHGHQFEHCCTSSNSLLRSEKREDGPSPWAQARRCESDGAPASRPPSPGGWRQCKNEAVDGSSLCLQFCLSNKPLTKTMKTWSHLTK